MSWDALQAFVAGCCAGFIGSVLVFAYSFTRPAKRRAGNGDCGAVGGLEAGDEPASNPVSLEEKNNSVFPRS
jgi:hypothetical protein